MTQTGDTVDSTSRTDPAPPRRSWRPFVVRLHFYAGVLIAPFILIAAVTGGLYAMAPSIERVIYGDILTVPESDQPIPLGDQAAAAQNAFPALTMTGMRPAADPGESTRVYFADPTLDEELRRAVFVDPYTGRVLGDEASWLGYLPVSTWLDGFHRHLNLGEPGQGIGVAEIDKPYRLTTNAASVDPVTNTVTSEIDYWRDYSVVAMLADWGIRGHMGLLFGLLNQLLLLGVAVALVAVIIGGYRMWWQRRPTRGSAWAVGRPPVRGGLRRLSPVATGVLVLAAVAVGWFLPLLGISLAAFVVADVVLGAAKQRKERTDA